ncbi:MAG TPA: MqnA/MqnD/SBP family protein [Sumerlaeia bacterium]|nr:MqnA/MqnD/SBP family protein [Sumerlaeia bacterium]
MRLTLGHSPDPDDAFMFCGLAQGKVATEGLEFEHALQDIETLNRRAENSELDVTALSAHAYAFLTDRYVLLNSGASMGLGYGPRVVAKRDVALSDLARRRIAVPGERTSAFLALRLCIGEFEYVVVAFDKIMDAVVAGEAEAGLLIHEGQLTYADQGLRLVVDLGAWWHAETGGLPLPLGVNAIRRDLPPDVIARADRVLRASIQWGLEHRTEALKHAAAWGRDLDAERTDRFVGMYVNDLTLDCGETGRRAIETLFERGIQAGLLPRGAAPEFVARD